MKERLRERLKEGTRGERKKEWVEGGGQSGRGITLES
jgi:hypothetical protein